MRVHESAFDALIFKHGGEIYAITSDGDVIARNADALSVGRAALNYLSDGGLLVFKYGDYTLTGITAEDNNYPVLPIKSGVTIDGNGSTFTIIDLPDDVPYNFLIFAPEAGQGNVTIRNMTIDGNRDGNPGPAKEYLIIAGDDTCHDVTVENVRCINSKRDGIVPRGARWRVLNCTTRDNEIAGIEFENATDLIVSGHVSIGDERALYAEGVNSRIVVSDFAYSGCGFGMSLGAHPETTIDGLSVANGSIDGFELRGIAGSDKTSRARVSSVALHGVDTPDFKAALVFTNGADVTNCEMSGYAGVYGTGINVSNSRIRCTYSCLDAHWCTLKGCTIERLYRTSVQCSDVIYDCCTYTNGILDEQCTNVQHINELEKDC